MGTSYWKAPEVINGEAYRGEVDVWSFGCILYELATGSPPFMWAEKTKGHLVAIVEDDVP